MFTILVTISVVISIVWILFFICVAAKTIFEAILALMCWIKTIQEN